MAFIKRKIHYFVSFTVNIDGEVSIGDRNITATISSSEEFKTLNDDIRKVLLKDYKTSKNANLVLNNISELYSETVKV